MRLARVASKISRGYLDGGVEGWKQGRIRVGADATDDGGGIEERISTFADLQVLDVRRQGEWDAGHIEGADWYPLDRFKAALPH